MSDATVDNGALTDIVVSMGAGNVDADKTQRVAIASDDVNLSVISTRATTIAGAVSGSEMQVDIVTSALPSGAATSAAQTTAQTSLSAIATSAALIDDFVFADDAAFTVATSKVAVSGGVYQATPDAIDDGDAGAVRMTSKRSQYVTVETPAGDSAMDETNNSVNISIVSDDFAFPFYDEGDVDTTISGAAILWEDASDTLRAVSAAKPLPVNVISSGGIADDAAFTVGTSLVTPAGAMFDDSSPDSVNEGDAGIVRMSANRNLYSTIRDAAGNERGANVNASSQLSVSVDNTVTVASHAVTNAGTFAVQATCTNAGTFAVQATAVGTIADDATTPGNPVMIGGKAVETDGTTPTAVSAEDDVAICRTDRNRRLLVSNIHPMLWKAAEDHSSAQTANELVAAPGANLSLYLTDVIISNGATAGTVKIVEDTAGAVDIIENIYVAINGGAVIHFVTPLRLTANKNLGFTSATCTTHSVTVSGFTAP